MRVGVVVAGVHPVGVHGAEVLLVQLDEGAGEVGAVAEALGKVVGLKLELAGEDVEEQLEDGVHGGQGVGEEDEANDNGVLGVEAKGRVQGGVVDEDGEEAEDVEQVDLGDAKEAGGVAELPVAELVGEDGHDFLGLAVLEEGVVDDNVLLPGQAVEEGVGVGAALAAVNDVELLEREVEGAGKLLDLCLELAILQRGELVEERLDEDWVRGDGQELDAGGEDPEVKDELAAGLLDNLEEAGEDRGHDDGNDGVGLDGIGDEEGGGLFVEAKLLLEDKGAVQAGRQAEALLDQDKGQDEEDGVADFSSEAGGRPLEQQVAGPGPELGEDIVVDKGNVLNLRPQAADEAELGLGAAVGLGLVKGFL